MSAAAADGDTAAMLWAIVFMILLIVFLDYFLWRPLVAWSQKFRVEDTGSTLYSPPLISQVIAHSFLVQQLRKGFRALIELRPKRKFHIAGGWIKRLSAKLVSVDFSVLLSRFSILFRGLYQLWVYYPLKKNRKSAKIIQKLDETQIRRQSLRPLSLAVLG